MSIIVMFLASVLILPVGMSYALTGNVTATTPSVKTMSNQTSTNKIMTQSPVSNQTGAVNTLTNSTVSQINDTQAAQQVSDFIHQATADFKQQGIDTRQVMLDCRDKLQTASPADMDNIRADCATQLSAIKVKYQDERNHYHELMKQYRQSVMVFLKDARGMTVDKSTVDKEVANLGMMMKNMKLPHGGVKGMMATLNNTNCVNPQGKPTGRC